MRRSLLLLFVAGCSVDQTVAMTTDDLPLPIMLDLAVGGAADLAQLKDIASAYPPSPYGHSVGDTIWPLVWEGYADPLADAIASSKTYGPYSMDDLRRSGRPYAAVHVAEFF
jgi:hypothetical protein